MLDEMTANKAGAAGNEERHAGKGSGFGAQGLVKRMIY
jgi:hypothetical protein